MNKYSNHYPQIKQNNVKQIIVIRTLTREKGEGIGDILLPLYSLINLGKSLDIPIFYIIPDHLAFHQELAEVFNQCLLPFITLKNTEFKRKLNEFDNPHALFILLEEGLVFANPCLWENTYTSSHPFPLVQIQQTDFQKKNKSIIHHYASLINAVLPEIIPYPKKTTEYWKYQIPDEHNYQVATVLLLSTSSTSKNLSLFQWFRLITLFCQSKQTSPIVLLGKVYGLRRYRIFQFFLENLPMSQDKVINQIEKTTLQQSFHWISKAKLFIGGDTGLTHFASILDRPLITFGYQNLYFAPISSQANILEQSIDEVKVKHIIARLKQVTALDYTVLEKDFHRILKPEYQSILSAYKHYDKIASKLEHIIDDYIPKSTDQTPWHIANDYTLDPYFSYDKLLLFSRKSLYFHLGINFLPDMIQRNPDKYIIKTSSILIAFICKKSFHPLNEEDYRFIVHWIDGLMSLIQSFEKVDYDRALKYSLSIDHTKANIIMLPL